MKSRMPALAILALVLLSWDASAQTRVDRRRLDAQKVESFGSVARVKLLQQARTRDFRSQDAMRLGATERRAVLTGTVVHVPKARQQPKHWR